MKEIIKYIADDGTEFTSKDTCIKYEKEFLTNLNRLEAISKRITELLQEKDKHLFCNAKFGLSEIFIKDGQRNYEVDENLDDFISMDDFDEIVNVIYTEFAFKFDVPIIYWSK